MSYIFKGETHGDTSNEYMLALGMNEEQIESVLNQMEFETKQNDVKAKVLRDSAIESDIEVNGLTFQVGRAARDNINEAINKCIRTGLPETESSNWIMADNSVATVTFADLKTVMNGYATRMADIYQQYALWRAGDKKQAFSL